MNIPFLHTIMHALYCCCSTQSCGRWSTTLELQQLVDHWSGWQWMTTASLLTSTCMEWLTSQWRSCHSSRSHVVESSTLRAWQDGWLYLDWDHTMSPNMASKHFLMNFGTSMLFLILLHLLSILMEWNAGWTSVQSLLLLWKDSVNHVITLTSHAQSA